MSATYYFAEEPGASSMVLEWFRNVGEPINETQASWGLILHFHTLGDLKVIPTGQLDLANSPAVTMFLPQIRRNALWTVGEVHFRSKNLRQTSPKLATIAKSFKAWLATHTTVWNHKPGADHEFAYHLEGSVRNWGGEICALPSGLAGLRRGQYFVSHNDNEAVLDQVCRTLRLRGVECGT